MGKRKIPTPDAKKGDEKEVKREFPEFLAWSRAQGQSSQLAATKLNTLPELRVAAERVQSCHLLQKLGY